MDINHTSSVLSLALATSSIVPKQHLLTLITQQHVLWAITSNQFKTWWGLIYHPVLILVISTLQWALFTCTRIKKNHPCRKKDGMHNRLQLWCADEIKAPCKMSPKVSLWCYHCLLHQTPLSRHIKVFFINTSLGVEGSICISLCLKVWDDYIFIIILYASFYSFRSCMLWTGRLKSTFLCMCF